MDLGSYFEGAKNALEDVLEQIDKMIEKESKKEYGVDLFINGKISAYHDVIALINEGLNRKRALDSSS